MKMLLLLALSVVAHAQAGTVTLTWNDKTNPAGTTYSIYRAPGTCGASSAFTRISADLSAKTFQDIGVVTGNYCYAATATINNVESAKSATASAYVPKSKRKSMLSRLIWWKN